MYAQTIALTIAVLIAAPDLLAQGEGAAGLRAVDSGNRDASATLMRVTALGPAPCAKGPGAASGDCPGTDKLVFITSARYTGNLGGIHGADAKCQAHAEQAGLPGSYKAWISDSNGLCPAMTFVRSPSPYRMVDGTLIARSWEDLIDGRLESQIGLDQRGEPPPRLFRGIGYWWVWTATRTDGTAKLKSPYGGGFCTAPGAMDWRTESPVGLQVGAGFHGLGSTENDILGLAWTEDGSQPCNLDAHLYCFQQ